MRGRGAVADLPSFDMVTPSRQRTLEHAKRMRRFPNSEIVTRPENILMAIAAAVPGALPAEALRPLGR
jgi:hypothetical protein